ncbi:Uncharacterized protein SCF082_LOCUS22099 [Durusdinium trenchii]|uniref:Legume lectin domain-containing protein n=1 Tax=Durusdinium trenchii TaxID=1381693 RepID=A0ABP0LDT7_9DINO
MLLVAGAVMLVGVARPAVAAEMVADDHVAVHWDFLDGPEGWAQATWKEMGAQIVVEGGELRGRVHGQAPQGGPHFDSPMFDLDVDDKYVVGMRIKAGGTVPRQGSVQLRLFEPTTFDVDFQSMPTGFGGGADAIVTVPFSSMVSPDGKFHIAYAPIHEKVRGHVVQMRVFPLSNVARPQEELDSWSTFDVDWIKLIKVPTILKVEGCINKYFDEDPLPLSQHLERRAEDNELVWRGGHANGTNAMVTEEHSINADNHQFQVTTFAAEDHSFAFATTFNCPRAGLGWRIRVSGRNFGHNVDTRQVDNVDTVFVDGQPCTDVEVLDVQGALECTLPPTTKVQDVDRVLVRVLQPEHRALLDERAFLSYEVAGPQMPAPQISNIGSHALDLSWDPPELMWDAATVTGYRITVLEQQVDKFFLSNEPLSPSQIGPFEPIQVVVVGNVTMTTIANLLPMHVYRFVIESLVEDQRHADLVELDLYGRRAAIPHAVASVPSSETASVSTLGEDIRFALFSANMTLSHGAVDSRSTVGPSGNAHGEGHFGLNLVGNAHIEHCNVSSRCCDRDGDGICALECRVLQDPSIDALNMEADRGVSSNAGDGSGNHQVGPPANPALVNDLPTCGGALRLTGSHPRSSGAAWYPRPMNVREGFEAEFAFRLSNPSLVCKIMDDVATHCRSRGADGIAFVVQNDDPFALGAGGMGLGYEGMENALAIEFDTFFNPEKGDAYENHVGVMTRGWREPVSSSHTFELGGAAALPDLANQVIRVKVVYEPTISPDALFSDSFVVSPHTSLFMTGHNPNPGEEDNQGRAEYLADSFGVSLEDDLHPRDWFTGVGLLQVFVQDLTTPLFSTALNLDATLRLQSGRAFLGFTAATGDSFWQTHDLLDWTFRSSRTSPVP